MRPEIFKCLKCHQEYDDCEKKPLLLPCGHNACQLCCQAIEKRSALKGTKKQCPNCRQNWDNISVKSLQVNFILIPSDNSVNSDNGFEFLEKTKGRELNNLNPSSKPDDAETNSITSDDCDDTEYSSEKECFVHDYAIDYWCNTHLEFICNQCIQDHHGACDFEILETKFRNLPKKMSDQEQYMRNVHRDLKTYTNERKTFLLTIEESIDSLQELKADYEFHIEDVNSVFNTMTRCLERIQDAREKLLGNYDPYSLLEEQSQLICEFTDLCNLSAPPPTPQEVFNVSSQSGVMSYQSKLVNHSFPSTLKEFGYHFNDEGKLSCITDGSPFKFEVKKNNPTYNQSHYEALGDVITEEVYNLLESECVLHRLPVPATEDSASAGGQGFIFASENWKTNDNLLILINGSGVVKAGQWARRLIINDSLDEGTQIPYIKKAFKMGFDVMVFNTNQRIGFDSEGNQKAIQANTSASSHAIYVWKHYVQHCKASSIAIVAHSAGGCVTTDLFRHYREDFINRVFAIGFTDSVHFVTDPSAFRPFIKAARNWVSSSQPLDTVLSHGTKDVMCVSAGVNVHERTSHSCIDSLFKFIDNMHQDFTTDDISEEPPREESSKKEELEVRSGKRHLDSPPAGNTEKRRIEENCEEKINYEEKGAKPKGMTMKKDQETSQDVLVDIEPADIETKHKESLETREEIIEMECEENSCEQKSEIVKNIGEAIEDDGTEDQTIVEVDPSDLASDSNQKMKGKAKKSKKKGKK